MVSWVEWFMGTSVGQSGSRVRVVRGLIFGFDWFVGISTGRGGLWVRLIYGYWRESNWFVSIGVVHGYWLGLWVSMWLCYGYQCGCAMGFGVVVLWFVGISVGQFV